MTRSRRVSAVTLGRWVTRLEVVAASLAARRKRLELLTRVDVHDKNCTVGNLQDCGAILADVLREVRSTLTDPPTTSD